MPTEQVYYVLANPPTTPEPERRSGKRMFVTLAIIGVGAYMIYQSDKKVQRLEEEARMWEKEYTKATATN